MKINKKYLEKNFPNKKKFFLSIFFIFIFFSILIFSVNNFKQKKISEKNSEIKEILIWSINNYKENFWEYPNNLNEIEKEEIINDIWILKEKDKIFYKKNWTWYFLEIKK